VACDLPGARIEREEVMRDGSWLSGAKERGQHNLRSVLGPPGDPEGV
jgi:hypothetical protein